MLKEEKKIHYKGSKKKTFAVCLNVEGHYAQCAKVKNIQNTFPL